MLDTAANIPLATHAGARVQALSQARLSNYRTFFGAADDDQVLGLYQWNEELGACLMRVVAKVEVVLRNQFHGAFSKRHGATGSSGSKDWYARVDLSVLSKAKIRDITHFRQGQQHLPRAPAPSPDDVVSRLTFGFWSHLLDLKRDIRGRPIDWGQILLEVLPGHRQRQVTHWSKQKHQDALFARLDLCNELCNRIAHHEPIWKLGPLLSEDRARHGSPRRQIAPAPARPDEALTRLRLLYGRLTELLGWLAPDVASHHATSELHVRCQALLRPDMLKAYRHGLGPATIDIGKAPSLRVLRKALRLAARRQQPILLKDGHRTIGHLTALIP
ncbi:Abi family protein [Mitsuaria sp. GD03876]|uniref:Abi family protein n=1 Tax=Mitsuaria sp. GD03876 TaxID=2975399 RepID=UPI00244A4AD8|nr:Abi family protein [Mitsuaria sp. GD03876]MDH0863492.1 Abi family protein [Mitsuaria sp. GD03876]